MNLLLPLKKLLAINPQGLAGRSDSMRYPETENPGESETSPMVWIEVHFVDNVSIFIHFKIRSKKYKFTC